jgi:hypothetical protein
MVCLLIVSALLVPVQRPARGRVAEISVPQGWTVDTDSPLVVLIVNHSSGASLRVVVNRRADELQAFAEREADRLANPLGFAQISLPQHFNRGEEESFQYEIRGNRLAAHRRILYRATRNSTGIIEIIYEHSEDRFNILLTEAQSIATQFLSR